MNIIRVGIIGMGFIGKHHADYLLAGKVNRCKLVAVCSTSPHKLEGYKAKGLKVFGNGEELIRSGLVDAVLIATPHYQHTALGIAALNAGLHVMSEKPISVHKADAERLIAVATKHPGQVFAVMLQLRVEPRYVRIRRLIQNGDLGEIVRLSWIVTDWYRTEAYYASGGWRATWKGEGGGVLLNQCLHNLDMVAWLFGTPARVRGFCQLGRFHNIEVEDNVSAYFEYPNGATGVLVTSTGEAPGTNRFEIAGTRGRLTLEEDRLALTCNRTDMIEFSKAAKQVFGKPDARSEEIPFANAAGPHAALMQNFVNAILDGEPLVAPAGEGIHSVELANAILYSSLIDQTVKLPMDSAAFERTLGELVANSRFKKNIAEASPEDSRNSGNR